jgi:hypothetical protein
MVNVDRCKTWVYTDEHDAYGDANLDPIKLMHQVPIGSLTKEEVNDLADILKVCTRMQQDASKAQSMEGTYQMISEELEPIINRALYDGFLTGNAWLTYTEIEQICGACYMVITYKEYGGTLPLSYIRPELEVQALLLGTRFDNLADVCSKNMDCQSVFEVYS